MLNGTLKTRNGRGARWPQPEQVKARLHTLEYLYDNSSLVLSTEQAKRLWACLGPGRTAPSPSTTPSTMSTSTIASTTASTIGAADTDAGVDVDDAIHSVDVDATGVPSVAMSTSETPGTRGEFSIVEAGTGAGATPGEVSTLLSWLSKACEAVEGEGGGGMFAPGVAGELFEVRMK